MSPVFEPPASSPLPIQPEEGSALWEVLYEAMGFHRDTDPETGYQLRQLCEVLMAPIQRVYDLVREREGRAAGGTMLDPDNVSAEGLDYLSQYVGAKLLPIMDEQQRRDEIKSPSTWKRGQPEMIKLIAGRTLTGTKWVRVRPRSPGPGRQYIRTLLSETPNPALVERELLADGIPAWDVLDYQAIEGVTVADVAAGWKTVAEVATAKPTVEDITDLLPEEIPE